MFYGYHNEYNHDTNYCRHLKDAIERLIQEGHVLDFFQRENNIPDKKRKEPKGLGKGTADPEGGNNEELSQNKGFIQMIVGGPAR